MKKQDTIVEFLQTKNEKLKEKIIIQNTPLIKKIINRRFEYSSDNDDLMQAGRLAICKAIDKYDPQKGAWTTIAAKAINNNLTMFVKKSENHTYGSYLYKRHRDGDDESLKLIAAESSNNKELKETVNYVFSQMDTKDVERIKIKFGFKDGVVNYRECKSSMQKFKSILHKSNISIGDFYNPSHLSVQ